MAKLWSCIALLVIAHSCRAYRILFVSPIPTVSHAILGEACVNVLLDGGHEVTYVTGKPNRLQRHPNLEEVDVSSNANHFYSDRFNLTRILDAQTSHFDILNHYSAYSVGIVKHDAVQTALIDAKQRKYDLVIAEWMMSEIYAGLPALLDCPLIWLSTMETHSTILSLVGAFPNPLYNADFGVTHMGLYSFLECIKHIFREMYDHVSKTFYIYFEETKAFNNLYTPMMKEFGKKLPPYQELRYNASLVLSNSHESICQPNQMPLNVISIGGYHISPEVEPLPEDLKKIMDNSKHGVIYFSMGSVLKSREFPTKLRTELLKVLGGLNQTVLWKLEENIPNLPSNVHVLEWASQQSILGHPNCILFITHGGHISVTESIHYAVPIIGIPGFSDQFGNIIRAERKGFAMKLNLTYDLAKDLEIAIKEVLGNPQYKEKVQKLSSSYHNWPIDPRKALLHWVEYVIRTQGAPLLKSIILKIPFYQIYYLDLVGLIAVIMLVLCKIVAYCKLFFEIIRCSGNAIKKNV